MKNIEQSVMEPAPAGKHKVTVTVEYTGQEPFVDEFAPEVPLQTVKRKAMKSFGLEGSAADQYALQFNGVDVGDQVKVGELGTEHVTLTLVRVNPQEKGYGRRAC